MAKMDKGKLTGDPVTYQRADPAGGVQMETFIPWTLVKRGVRRQVVTPLDSPQEFLEEARREQLMKAVAQDTPLMRGGGRAPHPPPPRAPLAPPAGRGAVHVDHRDRGGRGTRSRSCQPDCPIGAIGTGRRGSLHQWHGCALDAGKRRPTRQPPAMGRAARTPTVPVINRCSNAPYLAPESVGTARCRRSSTRSSRQAWA